MVQNFQCPSCGNFNAIGEPVCAKCGRLFQYCCPVCGSPVDNRYLRCNTCNTSFNWYKPIQQNTEITAVNTQQVRLPYPASQQSGVAPKQAVKNSQQANLPLTSRPVFWVILMIGCAVLIAILLFVARMAGI